MAPDGRDADQLELRLRVRLLVAQLALDGTRELPLKVRDLGPEARDFSPARPEPVATRASLQSPLLGHELPDLVDQEADTRARVAPRAHCSSTFGIADVPHAGDVVHAASQ
jgi:hypothetical protein